MGKKYYGLADCRSSTADAACCVTPGLMFLTTFGSINYTAAQTNIFVLTVGPVKEVTNSDALCSSPQLDGARCLGLQAAALMSHYSLNALISLVSSSSNKLFAAKKALINQL